MQVNIRLEGFASMKDTLLKVDFLRKDELLKKVGDLVLGRISARTKAGIDSQGRPFEPYSEQYAKKREKKGLQKTPDLEYSGAMLGNMKAQVDLDREQVTIYFPDPVEAQKAHFHNNEGAGKSKVVREFYDLNNDDITAVRELIKEHITECIAATKKNWVVRV